MIVVDPQVRHTAEREAREAATAAQTAALASLGFSPAFCTGSSLIVSYYATYCLTCGAMVPLLLASEDGAAHPLDVHTAWHRNRAI